MWPFRRKHVVHVDVKENLDTTTNPEARIATFKIAGQAESPFYFNPKSFKYSNEIVSHVKGRLPVGFSEKDRNRTLVKVWRDANTRDSPVLETKVVSTLVFVLALELLLVLVLIVAGALIDQTAIDDLAPGAALTAIAANVAYFISDTAARSTKLGQPFEYTKWQRRRMHFIVLGSIAINLVAYFQLAALLPWPEVALFIQRWVSILGLVATVVGAGISGATGAFKWIIAEELQRESEIARKVVDFIEFRTHA